MNINSSLINEMNDKAYRDAYVVSQIRTALPFQLRALRTSRKWSQELLAEKAGMAQPRISDLERPTGRMPNLDTLCRIAAACDVAVEVRFVPFSELIDRSEHFDPENFNIPTFDDEITQAEERENALVAALSIPTGWASATIETSGHSASQGVAVDSVYYAFGTPQEWQGWELADYENVALEGNVIADLEKNLPAAEELKVAA